MLKFLILLTLFNLVSSKSDSSCYVCMKTLKERGGVPSLKYLLLADCDKYRKTVEYDPCLTNARKLGDEVEVYYRAHPNKPREACEIAKWC